MNSIKGIDVSEHQNKINWDKAKADGVKFAILRCGYGMDIKSQDDSEFERNAKECERLGIPYGVYLFSYANTVEKAKSEAEHTLRLIKNKKLNLGVWYDIEDNKTSGSISKTLLTEIINTYCEKIEKNGYKIGIYASTSWLNNKIDKSVKEKYLVWVAQYNNKCEYAGNYVIWQYSSSGKVSGVYGNVDMNYLYNENLIASSTTTNTTTTTSSSTGKDRVKELQAALNKDFKANLDVDGVIGQATTKVVKKHYLKYYTSGSFVKWTQTQLKRKKYSIGASGIDGCYGKDTVAAVKKYQKDNKLVVDGCVGTDTVKSLAL